MLLFFTGFLIACAEVKCYGDNLQNEARSHYHFFIITVIDLFNFLMQGEVPLIVLYRINPVSGLKKLPLYV